MPNEALIALATLAAYLLGSVPFAVIVSRAFRLADPRTYGSKNPGATNVLRSGNKKAAALTLLGDALKGWLAVFLAQHYQLGNLAIGLVALAVFFGHLYPIFLRFKGGKGVATAAGVLFGLNPALGVGVIGVWVSVAFASRYSSLAAVCAAAAAPLLTGMLVGSSGGTLPVVCILSAALIVKHWQNIQRLMTGQEGKIGSKKS